MTKLEWCYHDGGRVAAGFPHARTRDCVVRAVAIVTGAPYLEVYKEAERIKRRRGKQAPDKGFPSSAIKPLLVTFAGSVKKVYPHIMKQTHYGATVSKAALKAENLPPVSRCLVLIRTHSLAVIEGVVYDTWNPAKSGRRKIDCYYVVTQKPEYQ